MIEDVDYLKENSEIDSIAFFADSSLRNQKTYPVPSEYSIEFSQPFKNVVGFDILDAAVPTTMYNVDAYNCTLNFSVVKSSDKSVYPPESIVESIRFCSKFIDLFEDTKQTYLVITESTVETLSEVSPYVCAVRRLLDVQVSRSYSMPSPEDQGDYYYFRNNKTFYKVPKDNPNVPILKQDNLEVVGDSVYYYEFGYISADEYGRLKGDRTTHIGTISNIRQSIELGNYDVTSLKVELNSVMNAWGVFFESTALTDKKQGKYKITSYDYMLLNANINNSLSKNLGFDLYPSDTDASISIGNNEKVFVSRYDEVKRTYAITAPGIVNLMGERFIILRCKEIEDHLYGSFSYSSFIPGIAMFKMGAVTDISNVRFDYVSLVRKPFHPIGKLLKLTFRFETADGKLYDFKGVNNQMLLMIKFRVPTQKTVFQKSILNPNYESDFIRYMYEKRDIAAREQSDDEQEFDTRANYITYRKKLAEYDYSSSEEDDSDDDSEVDV